VKESGRGGKGGGRGGAKVKESGRGGKGGRGGTKADKSSVASNTRSSGIACELLPNLFFLAFHRSPLP